MWNHTTHYHDRLLAAVPVPCVRALDVGCGTGAFARLLATRAISVDALDRDGPALARARDQSRNVENLRYLEGDFLSTPLDHEAYDFVSMLAVLHHLPMSAAIDRAVAALRPGGVLGIIGVFRDRTVADLARSAIAWPVATTLRLTRGFTPPHAPVCDAQLDFAETASALHARLPDAQISRHLLWRYTLVWKKPMARD